MLIKIHFSDLFAFHYNEFIKILQDLDYIVTDKNNTLSIRRDPYKRNTRIERQFGEEYTMPSIVTDSEALKWLNDAKLKGKIVTENDQLRIEIYEENT